MNLTVKQLTYLVALADHLNFSRAAEACFVTQPALSEQIQQMEAVLEVQLVERSHRKVVLTSIGEELAERSRRILRDLEDMADLARRSAAPFSSALKLGVIPTIAPYLIPRVLPDIHGDIDRLKLLLREDQTDRLLSQLRTGSLDLAVLALPVRGDDLDTRPLYEEDFVVIAPPGRTFGRKRKLKQADLKGEDVLLLEEGHCLRDQALDLCQRVGAHENTSFRATSLGTLVQMVTHGIGLTLLPRLALEVEVRGRQSPSVFEFAPPLPSRTVGLAWRKMSARKNEIIQFGDIMRKHLQALEGIRVLADGPRET